MDDRLFRLREAQVLGRIYPLMHQHWTDRDPLVEAQVTALCWALRVMRGEGLDRALETRLLTAMDATLVVQ